VAVEGERESWAIQAIVWWPKVPHAWVEGTEKKGRRNVRKRACMALVAEVSLLGSGVLLSRKM
jgi:hypothetical protein